VHQVGHWLRLCWDARSAKHKENNNWYFTWRTTYIYDNNHEYQCILW